MSTPAVMRPATALDAAFLSTRVRVVEVDEVMASTGQHIAAVLAEGVRDADEAWSVFLGGELACIWGVTADPAGGFLGGRRGSVWLLASDAVERHAKVFWRLCRSQAPLLLDRWDALWNAIDVRHEKAVRWALRLGLPLEEPKPYGVSRLPFRRFVVTKEDLHVRTRGDANGASRSRRL